MINLLGKLWRDQRGTGMAGDWVFVATILILGAVTGLVTMRQTHLTDLGDAVKVQHVNRAPAAAK
jgi:hypothetical protein